MQKLSNISFFVTFVILAFALWRHASLYHLNL